ncbi:hypothetical protein CEUSTIGMA_g9880.t1 [Chlamydomonas eustigma]|uniref:Uncharacterized protein n=1 Tax=Chlamydomonas eustigma TaxID=1157962 RepID=A0A250XHD0_9CHLO|nr:hypothetical protein CEUSTIGMA_g9880.t1 [Chlamydomonas eustigma]|eukprot:GAX82453.1 hypothetical protein CEUSTIGMA_g9880.t1 [Chlamydomonas eustigma]
MSNSRPVFTNDSVSPSTQNSLRVQGSHKDPPQALSLANMQNYSVPVPGISNNVSAAIPENSPSAVVFNKNSRVANVTTAPPFQAQNATSFGTPVTMRKAGGFEALVQAIAMKQLKQPYHYPLDLSPEHSHPDSFSVTHLVPLQARFAHVTEAGDQKVEICCILNHEFLREAGEVRGRLGHFSYRGCRGIDGTEAWELCQQQFQNHRFEEKSATWRWIMHFLLFQDPKLQHKESRSQWFEHW